MSTDTLNDLQGHAQPDMPTRGRPARVWAADVVTVNTDGTVDIQPVQSRATKVGVEVPAWYTPTIGDRVIATDLNGDPRQPIVLVPKSGTLAVSGGGYAQGQRTLTANTTLIGSDEVIIADARGLLPPENLALSQTTGGSFAPGTFYWAVTATDALGRESAHRHTAARFAVAASGKVTLTWNAVAGATGYKVYRMAFNATLPDNATPVLLATLGNVLTYVDTGTATTSGNPPTTNGGAFTITLPTAAGVAKKRYTIKAVAGTPNLVTVQGTSGQTIDGASTVLLGTATGASYQGISVVSDGANWQIERFVPLPRVAMQAARPYSVPCPVNVPTLVLLMEVTPLTYGQFAIFDAVCQLTAGYGTYQLLWTLNWCDSSGAPVTFAGQPGTPIINSNLAFWTDDDFAVGTLHTWRNKWLYQPRQGDWAYYTSQRWLGLFLQPNALAGTTAAAAVNPAMSADVGAINSVYYPTSDG